MYKKNSFTHTNRRTTFILTNTYTSVQKNNFTSISAKEYIH